MAGNDSNGRATEALPKKRASNELNAFSIVTALAPGESVRKDDGFRRSLADQILWLIALRWVAGLFIVAGTLTGAYVFPVLTKPVPLYLVAGALLLCNLAHVAAARRIRSGRERRGELTFAHERPACLAQ